MDDAKRDETNSEPAGFLKIDRREFVRFADLNGAADDEVTIFDRKGKAIDETTVGVAVFLRKCREERRDELKELRAGPECDENGTAFVCPFCFRVECWNGRGQCEESRTAAKLMIQFEEDERREE